MEIETVFVKIEPEDKIMDANSLNIFDSHMSQNCVKTEINSSAEYLTASNEDINKGITNFKFKSEPADSCNDEESISQMDMEDIFDKEDLVDVAKLKKFLKQRKDTAECSNIKCENEEFNTNRLVGKEPYVKKEVEEEDTSENLQLSEAKDLTSKGEAPPKKRAFRRHFSVAEKEAIMNIYKECEQNHPNYNKLRKVKYTAEAAGVTSRSVYNILNSYEKTHTFEPPKKYHRARSVLDNIEEETKNAIRQIIHSFFQKDEPPTVKKILSEIEKIEEIPNFKEATFRHLLREIGFRFVHRSRNTMLKEDDEIIRWRRRYLQSIKKARQENKKIYYLDETTGLKAPTGDGKRLVVLHIGSENGFVQNGQLVFESKRTKDYLEMNAQVFEKWFENILPRLEAECVIVLDNASYNTRKLDKTPTSATKKTDIQNWLGSKEIPYDQDMGRAELLNLVKENRHVDTFVLDEIAKATGRTVLRLPPYHSQLNPIELMWAQIKGDLVRKNVALKLEDLKPLFDQAVQNFSTENWKKAIDHIIKEEERMWSMDNEPLGTNVGEDGNTSSVSNED